MRRMYSENQLIKLIEEHAGTGYYIHNVNVSASETHDEFSITGMFQYIDQSSTPIASTGWQQLVQSLINSIGTVQFTGEILQGGSPNTLLNPVFFKDGNPTKLGIYSGLAYDHSEETFDVDGVHIYLSGQEQVTLTAAITDTVIPL